MLPTGSTCERPLSRLQAKGGRVKLDDQAYPGLQDEHGIECISSKFGPGEEVSIVVDTPRPQWHIALANRIVLALVCDDPGFQ